MDTQELFFSRIKMTMAVNMLNALEHTCDGQGVSSILTQSSCKVADELNELYKTLQDIELKLNEVVRKTKEAMVFAGVSFETTDKKSAMEILKISLEE